MPTTARGKEHSNPMIQFRVLTFLLCTFFSTSSLFGSRGSRDENLDSSIGGGATPAAYTNNLVLAQTATLVLTDSSVNTLSSGLLGYTVSQHATLSPRQETRTDSRTPSATNIPTGTSTLTEPPTSTEGPSLNKTESATNTSTLVPTATEIPTRSQTATISPVDTDSLTQPTQTRPSHTQITPSQNSVTPSLKTNSDRTDSESSTISTTVTDGTKSYTESYPTSTETLPITESHSLSLSYTPSGEAPPPPPCPTITVKTVPSKLTASTIRSWTNVTLLVELVGIARWHPTFIQALSFIPPPTDGGFPAKDGFQTLIFPQLNLPEGATKPPFTGFANYYDWYFNNSDVDSDTIIRFWPGNKNYEISVDEEIEVLAPASAIRPLQPWCEPVPTSTTITVYADDPQELLASMPGIQLAVASVAMTAGAASGLSYILDAQALAMVGTMACGYPIDRLRTKSLNFFLSPFTDYGEGAMLVGNFALSLGILCLHALIGKLCAIFSFKPTMYGFALARFPAITATFITFFHTGIAFIAFRALVRLESNPGERVMGFFGTGYVVAAPLLGIKMLSSPVGSNLVFNPYTIFDQSPIQRFVAPQGSWGPEHERRLFGRLVQSVHGDRKLWSFYPVITMAAIALASAPNPETIWQCQLQYAALGLGFLICAGVITWIRPHNVPVSNLFSIIGMVLLSILCFVKLASMGAPSPDLDGIMTNIVILVLIWTAVRVVTEMSILFAESFWWRKQQYRRDHPEEFPDEHKKQRRKLSTGEEGDSEEMFYEGDGSERLLSKKNNLLAEQESAIEEEKRRLQKAKEIQIVQEVNREFYASQPPPLLPPEQHHLVGGVYEETRSAGGGAAGARSDTMSVLVPMVVGSSSAGSHWPNHTAAGIGGGGVITSADIDGPLDIQFGGVDDGGGGFPSASPRSGGFASAATEEEKRLKKVDDERKKRKSHGRGKGEMELTASQLKHYQKIDQQFAEDQSFGIMNPVIQKQVELYNQSPLERKRAAALEKRKKKEEKSASKKKVDHDFEDVNPSDLPPVPGNLTKNSAAPSTERNLEEEAMLKQLLDPSVNLPPVPANLYGPQLVTNKSLVVIYPDEDNDEVPDEMLPETELERRARKRRGSTTEGPSSSPMGNVRSGPNLQLEAKTSGVDRRVGENETPIKWSDSLESLEALL